MSAHGGVEISGATVLVTGGNRGFGRALVDEFLARGAEKVYSAARGPQAPGDARIVPVVIDVTDDASVAAAAATASDVTIVVNNAGISNGSAILESPLADIEAELDTNLFGPIRVARAFAPALRANQPASLVNVLSVLSWLSMGRGYEISKAAAWSASNALRLALAGSGITVTGLHVGYMDTDLIAHLDVPKADPRAIAVLTADAIEHGDHEVLADDTTRMVRSALSNPDITGLYPSLVRQAAA